MKKYLFLFLAFTLIAHISFSQTVDELIDIGERYLLEGLFQEAHSVGKEAIRLNPNHALAHLHIGVVYYRLNDMLLALDSFSRAIELDNTFAEAYAWRAKIFQNLNNPVRARHDYNMAVYLDQENDRFRTLRGVFLYTVIGDFISALNDLNRAVEINPLNHLNFQHRGVLLSKLGLDEMALEDYNSAIRLNSEDTMNFSNKGVSLAFLGRYEEAIESFSIAVQLDNNNYRAFFDRGYVHFRLGIYNEAILDFSEVIRIHPNSRHYRLAYSNRAFTYRRLAEQVDNPIQARYYLNRALIDEEIVTRLDGQRE